MVWYNPLTWFKNTPKKVETPTTPIQTWTWGTIPITWNNLTWSILTWNNAWVINWNALTWNNKSAISFLDSQIQWLNSKSVSQPSNLSSTVTMGPVDSVTYKNSENPFKDNRSRWTKLRDFNTQLNSQWTAPVEKALQAKWEADRNARNAKVLDKFSLDTYWVDSESTQNKLDLSVDSKEKTSAWSENFWTKEDLEKNFMLALWNKVINNIQNDKDNSIWDMYDITKNTLERQFPNTLWAYDVYKAVKKEYWWDWFVDKEWTTESNPDPFKYKYIWPNNLEFNKTLFNLIPTVEQAYTEWYISWEDYEQITDDIYNEFKNDISVEWLWWTTRKMMLDWSISKDAFMRYAKNIVDKETFRREENERRWLPNDEDTSSTKIAEWVQMWLNIIWPKVELSNFWTVEDRQEFMNDAYANLYDFVGRLYNHMYPVLSVKSMLQYELWVDNLWDISYEEVPDRWKPLYRKIQKAEWDFNKLITNHAEYISYLPSAIDPNTWKLDRMPDFVTDWWNTRTYTSKLFDWIRIDEDDTFMWWSPLMSPIDVMQMEAMNIKRMWSNETEWLMWNLWEWTQYWWARTIWATYQELWQAMQWYTLRPLFNLLSSDSWDIPYEFMDMDSSLMATMTTNDSNRWRLMQTYWTKYFEYAPELIASIREVRNADKIWEALWVWAQARLLNLMNKNKWFKNTVKGQQTAQFLAYTMRAWQRLGTDQLVIDAPLSISDTEWWSDFSNDLSVYGTLFWEWVWILMDLRALWNSVWRNFKKTNKYDAIHDPIRLIADDPHILDWVAEHLWRVSVDESWKIVWDSYKLLIQDLSSYSKYLNDLSTKITDVVTNVLKSWWDINVSNQVIKQWAYNVLKQVFKQNSAMSKIVSDMVTDQRANLADIVKYVWNLDGTVKIWPFISTIKVNHNWQLINKTALKYNPWMDLVIDWWLIAWINRWLTRAEVDELVRKWYIKASDISAQWDNVFALDKYFAPYKMPDGEIRYYPTQKWLDLMWVDASNVSNPLAIALMSNDTKELIEKLKQLPENKRVLSDTMLDAIWETNAIEWLAENLADIKYLDICK